MKEDAHLSGMYLGDCPTCSKELTSLNTKGDTHDLVFCSRCRQEWEIHRLKKTIEPSPQASSPMPTPPTKVRSAAPPPPSHGLRRDQHQLIRRNEDLEDRLSLAKRQEEHLTNENRQLQSERFSTKRELEKQEKAAIALRDLLLRYTGGFIFPLGSQIGPWLSAIPEESCRRPWVGPVAITGHGPIPTRTMAANVAKHGLTVCPVGAASASILIVGRDGWTPEELDSHIHARNGEQLRVYSQEMALVLFGFGADPFDASLEVLQEFGLGHPALEYLMSRELPWPSLDSTGLSPLVIDTDTWRTQGVLGSLGYHVGHSGAPESARRRLLQGVVELEMVFPTSFLTHEKEAWGDPSTPKRLKHLVYTIAGFARLHGGRDADMSCALEDWRSDLLWLRERYASVITGFRWPDTTVNE